MKILALIVVVVNGFETTTVFKIKKNFFNFFELKFDTDYMLKRNGYNQYMNNLAMQEFWGKIELRFKT